MMQILWDPCHTANTKGAASMRSTSGPATVYPGQLGNPNLVDYVYFEKFFIASYSFMLPLERADISKE